MGFFRGHTTYTRAEKISEFTVNTAEYGTAVPEVIGTTRLSGNVIYYDDFTAHEHREEQRSGKGGGSKSVSITYTYTVAVILGLCEGPIDHIGRVWRNKEIYSYPDSKIELTAFNGTQNQSPWAYVTGKHPDKALSYPGLAYMAGVVDLGTGASLPQFNFEIFGKLLTTGDGYDANPADYIRYVLDKAGFSNVPVSGLDSYRSYCANANLLISSPPDNTPKAVRTIVNEIASLTNAYFFWSNDRFKIVPLETRALSGWTPDNTIRYALTADDFQPQSNGALVTYSRKDSSEVYNSFPVEFLNRANGYEKETVNYQITSDIQNHGLRQAPTTSAHYIYTKGRAVKVAETLARKGQLERNTYTFKLDWAFCRLEPGDLVTITDPNIGVENLVVRIKEIREDSKTTITCTAVATDLAATEAEYDVHANDRPYVNFNIAPPDTTPLFFQPPAELTRDGLELWIGAKGSGDGWGGCTVYISDDNINYRMVGQINNSARIGSLQQSMTATATECVVSCNDVLLSGTEQDAERGNTLCWINGECFSYTTATLVSAGVYRLSGLVRGQYNTTAVAHSSGDSFARLDNTLLKEAFRKEDVGKAIYLKFCSFNIFGAMEQSLADVQPYYYVLQSYFIPAIRNLAAFNRFRQLKDGVNRYDIVVRWNEPNLQSYLEGRLWYKTNAGQTKYLNFTANVPINELGFAGEWIFGGAGKNEVVIPQAIVGDIYRIAVTTVDKWGAETSPDAAPQTTIKVMLKTETPNTPDGFSIAFGEACVASWKEVANTDVAYYEVRNDNSPGAETVNLLARVTGLQATLPLTSRSGTLYLYAYSASGKYSAPAILQYEKAAPPKPNAPSLANKIGGFALSAGAIPNGCNGMNIYIDGASLVQVHTVNNVYTHACEAGIYDVSCAYTDIFGEGEHSAESRITVKATIDSSLLEAQAVTKEKLAAAVQTTLDNSVQTAQDLATLAGTVSGQGTSISNNTAAITSLAYDVGQAETNISLISQKANSIEATVNNLVVQGDVNQTAFANIAVNADNISAIVGNLNNINNAVTNYSAFAALSTGIASKVSLGDMSSWLQQDHTGFYIKASLVDIDATTRIGNNIISSNMIQTSAVTADKISVTSLSAICATIGLLRTASSGARLEVESNQIRVYDGNGVLRVRMGVW